MQKNDHIYGFSYNLIHLKAISVDACVQAKNSTFWNTALNGWKKSLNFKIID